VVRGLPHGTLNSVEFVALDGTRVAIDLPKHEDAEIAVKRSLLDDVLLNRARSVGAEVQEDALVTRIEKARWGDWKIDIVRDKVTARILVAADGRNSTVARLRNLLPRVRRERIALQAHIPLPEHFGNRVVLQILPEGYSGQAPVNDNELNLCLVGNAADAERLKFWAARVFDIAPLHPWRTITPLSRDPLGAASGDLFLVGDAARVVEPFTGEGIYYALRSGELAAGTIIKIILGEDPQTALQQFASDHRQLYAGRLWINQLARTAVLSPQIGSAFVRVARIFPGALRILTDKITR
jgi:flavin-dependent dehydrogenase